MSSTLATPFFPARLDQALAIRKLTQRNLALCLTVKEDTVSQWLSGKQKPSLNSLRRIALILRVKPVFFTTPLRTGLGYIHFPRQSRALLRKCKAWRYEMKWAEEIVERLQVYLDLPKNDFPRYDFECFDEITDQNIEEAAFECRRRWELKEAPIQDLLLAAEGAGFIGIRKKTHCPSITSFSAWSDRIDKPLIFLSSDQNNAYSSRFDLAREIGHTCLHTSIPQENISRDHKQGTEQAQQFARALLLPARPFSRDVTDEPRIGDFLLLKKKWGVSVITIIKRLKQLDLISERKEQYLIRRRNVLWGNVQEPGDDNRLPEEPRLLRRSLNLLLENSVLVPEGVADYFCLSNDDLKAFLYLPNNYFSTFRAHARNVHKLRFK